MKRNLKIVKILSHGSWLSRARKKAWGQLNFNPILKVVLGSVTLGFMVSLVSCSATPDSSTLGQNTPNPTNSPSISPNSSQAISPLFSDPNSSIPKNQISEKENSNQVKPPNPEITKATKSPGSASKAMVAINIYQANNQCSDFIAERTEVLSNNSLEMAVAKVIERSNINAFNLASYKVVINPQTAIATIDFQVAANSKRTFISLSSCEQFNLFGSLRKTLIDNPDWQIKDVRFTEQGKELNL